MDFWRYIEAMIPPCLKSGFDTCDTRFGEAYRCRTGGSAWARRHLVIVWKNTAVRTKITVGDPTNAASYPLVVKLYRMCFQQFQCSFFHLGRNVESLR